MTIGVYIHLLLYFHYPLFIQNIPKIPYHTLLDLMELYLIQYKIYDF